MGVKYNREYKEIVEDFMKAILQIDDCYDAFEMEQKEWLELAPEEQRAYLRTLADDLFYGLGTSRTIAVGSGQIRYNPSKHTIQVTDARDVVRIVNLV
ncbi:hypothetical protein DUZ99_11855 [Xylanibacillus composti]|uniref:Uncharacterized protein n=1 Tax=Xylanibacillus composti TaxID=1572762 RepID=A0A8J4H2Z9_9BACL|nr:hypothetical protein [Xylanibacillus composti]MDT9725668.1 hypothetical protein [Xylanibacillus composti]GIQ67763.1 hypothetical protein XYCOK13_05870 [Xylanibacillus composti]